MLQQLSNLHPVHSGNDFRRKMHLRIVVLVKLVKQVKLTKLTVEQPATDSLFEDNQGQSTLNSIVARDWHQEVVIPATDSAFHGEAVFAGMLFEQRQSEASNPC